MEDNIYAALKNNRQFLSHSMSMSGRRRVRICTEISRDGPDGPGSYRILFCLHRKDPVILFLAGQAFRTAFFILCDRRFYPYAFYNIGFALVRPDGFFPQNQMLASFSILIVVLQGFDWCAHKKWLRGLCAILIPILLPFAVSALMMAFPQPVFNFSISLLVFTVLPIHSFIMDGGTAVLLFGVILYLSRRNRKLQAAAFIVTTILWDIVRLHFMAPGLRFIDFFTLAYEWMEVFAVIPMLCYNGTKGRGSKRLFYWFYPVHIYVLYALSCLLYLFLNR